MHPPGQGADLRNGRSCLRQQTTAAASKHCTHGLFWPVFVTRMQYFGLLIAVIVASLALSVNVTDDAIVFWSGALLVLLPAIEHYRSVQIVESHITSAWPAYPGVKQEVRVKYCMLFKKQKQKKTRRSKRPLASSNSSSALSVNYLMSRTSLFRQQWQQQQHLLAKVARAGQPALSHHPQLPLQHHLHPPRSNCRAHRRPTLLLVPLFFFFFPSCEMSF